MPSPRPQTRSRQVPPRHPLGRGSRLAHTAPTRPQAAPFAAAFGLLVAVVDGYLGWLLWDADPGWGWYLLAPGALAALALLGAVLVWRGTGVGRLPGWLVLVLACLLPLVGLVLLAGFFGVLGGGSAAWTTLLLAVGPLVGLVLAAQQPVREWAGAGRRPPAVARAR
ncbi:hypothetical protein [Modestobacter roseus]|uniref:Uncharacterized protein n=1 Tax=Modestobacter roseus TaxID=1181884 RepID=A0A562IPA5_9ACTN|nr:hypothetical protein [Modestobacter roseus]MQA34993.1 hypothetical protein [Modestobacter roseus]TWH72424.1 hypothetical protein JD78_00935 [Modestobacter roseus]